MIEKILEQIDENTLTKESVYFLNEHGIKLVSASKMKEIVQEVAKEYGKDTNVRSNGWILCSERLPESSGDVLIATRSWIVGVGSFHGHNHGWLQWYAGGGIRVDVIAWQPLPPAYRKEN